MTLPSIDLITDKVRNLGKGSLLYKIDISRAFRHVKIDPRDYFLLDYFLGHLFTVRIQTRIRNFSETQRRHTLHHGVKEL